MNSVSQVIDSIKDMSTKDKASIAQQILISLDEPVEDGSEKEWLRVAERRFDEIEKGEVTGVSWQSIRSKLGK